MKLDQTRVDISTLVSRIKKGELDLQPNFQRGLVWPESKKKRLIDTILREWYIPAIHLVVNDELDREEVLDGQQRLQSIMDFIDGSFTIDGNTSPFDSRISSLNGLSYAELPTATQSRFKRFAIETVRLRDFRSDEPGELFFRLNQITALTSSEQRNALIGKPRNQIKEIVECLEESVGPELIGFTNARLNYDDTVSRLALALESGSLANKTTAQGLERRYRLDSDFSQSVVQSIKVSIRQLGERLVFCNGAARLNRASLFSWLYFFADHAETIEMNSDESNTFFAGFELAREGVRANVRHRIPDTSRELATQLLKSPGTRMAAAIFSDRASSRVNDVSSILLRDFSLNYCLKETFEEVLVFSSESSYREPLEKLGHILEESSVDPGSRLERESYIAREWESFRASRSYTA